MPAEKEPEKPEFKTSCQDKKRNADDDKPSPAGIKTLGRPEPKNESQIKKVEVQSSEAKTRNPKTKRGDMPEHEAQATVKTQRSIKMGGAIDRTNLMFESKAKQFAKEKVVPTTADVSTKRKCHLEMLEPSKARKLSKEAELMQDEPEEFSKVDHSKKPTQGMSHDAPDAK